jgi:hypothetical protein
MNEFQTPLRKLDKGDVYASTSFWKVYKSFTPLFETIFNLTMAWSSLSSSSTIVSGDAWLDANVWLYVMNWPCVNLFDYD